MKILTSNNVTAFRCVSIFGLTMACLSDQNSGSIPGGVLVFLKFLNFSPERKETWSLVSRDNKVHGIWLIRESLF